MRSKEWGSYGLSHIRYNPRIYNIFFILDYKLSQNIQQTSINVCRDGHIIIKLNFLIAFFILILFFK